MGPVPSSAQLRIKATAYANEQAKVRLPVNRLRDEALHQVLPHIADDRINLTNLATLTTILHLGFGNPNRVAEVEATL